MTAILDIKAGISSVEWLKDQKPIVKARAIYLKSNLYILDKIYFV
jgi:hypothetical protein